MSMRWESFFSQLMADFIGAAAVSAEWPAELAALVRHTQDFTGAVVKPRLYFETSLAEGGHKKARVGSTEVRLETIVPVGEEVAANAAAEGIVKPLVASSWMHAISRRLMDHEALQAWLQAQPVERRKGWSLLVWPWISDSDEVNDEAERTRAYSHTVAFKFRFE